MAPRSAPPRSLNHMREDPAAYGGFGSRFPRKLAEAVTAAVPDSLCVSFNFSGTPGSDDRGANPEGLPFRSKTVTKELADAETVVRFVRARYMAPAGPGGAPIPAVHVIGLSTGAIVASLLRGSQCDERLSVTAVAGLLDAAAVRLGQSV